ncbi:Transthyretin-like family protein [Oesophagostomum dentatum]|uniref:Transthyretin-like family protein n=1 Tax=Oesophagostomum dentatum TaxID=61180 RepID=A0A0B1SXV7_OESDE|nr:Transthyretin-like family protein [Oesophagostomum dentatum]
MQQIFLLLATALCCSAMRLQAVGVTGRLMCGSKPASNVRVKLWEEDEGPDPDDLLDQGYTNATGHFRLQVRVDLQKRWICSGFTNEQMKNEEHFSLPT